MLYGLNWHNWSKNHVPNRFFGSQKFKIKTKIHGNCETKPNCGFVQSVSRFQEYFFIIKIFQERVRILNYIVLIFYIKNFNDEKKIDPRKSWAENIPTDGKGEVH